MWRGYGGAVSDRPGALLFLDVDGPLIPFGGPQPHPVYQLTHRTGGNPLLATINPAHGRRLLALSCQLVWATTWGEDANQDIAPFLGLPALPVVTWPQPSAAEEQDDERHGLHWKTRTLVSWAAGRPFAWADDEITSADRTWTGICHPGPALLHRIDPATGLTDADYLTLGGWLLTASAT